MSSNFSNYLQRQLTVKNMSKYQLAKKSGVTMDTIKNILEREDYYPRMDTITKLCIALDEPYVIYDSGKGTVCRYEESELQKKVDCLTKEDRLRVDGYIDCLMDK